MPQPINSSLKESDFPILGLSIGRALSTSTDLKLLWVPDSSLRDLPSAIVYRANKCRPLEVPFAVLVDGSPTNISGDIPTVQENDLIRVRLRDRLAVIAGQRSALESNRKSFVPVMDESYPQNRSSLEFEDLAKACLSEIGYRHGGEQLAQRLIQDPQSSIERLAACFTLLCDYFLTTSPNRSRDWNHYWFEHIELGLQNFSNEVSSLLESNSKLEISQVYATRLYPSFGLPNPAQGNVLRHGKGSAAKELVNALENWWAGSDAVTQSLNLIAGSRTTDKSLILKGIDWIQFDQTVLATEDNLTAFISHVPATTLVSGLAQITENEFFNPVPAATSKGSLSVSGPDGESRDFNRGSGPASFYAKTPNPSEEMFTTEILTVTIPLLSESVLSSNPDLNDVSIKSREIGAVWTSSEVLVVDAEIQISGYFVLPSKLKYGSSLAISPQVTPGSSLKALIDPRLSADLVILPPVTPVVVVFKRSRSRVLSKPIFVVPEIGQSTTPLDVPASHENALVIVHSTDPAIFEGQSLRSDDADQDVYSQQALISTDLNISCEDFNFVLRAPEKTGAIQSPVVAAIYKQPLTGELPQESTLQDFRGRFETALSSKTRDQQWLDSLGHVLVPVDQLVDLSGLFESENLGVLLDEQTQRVFPNVNNFKVERGFRESVEVQEFIKAFQALDIASSLVHRSGNEENPAWPSRTSWRQLSSDPEMLLAKYLSAFETMVASAKESGAPANIFWASYPFSVSVWDTTESGKCQAVLLSPLHPIRMAWLSQIEETLFEASLASELAGPVEGWNFPLLGPSPTNPIGMVAIPTDNGEDQIFLGWSLLVPGSMDGAEPLTSPSKIAGRPAPGSSGSGMNSSSTDAALRAFRRVNPHVSTLTIDLASATKTARLVEIDKAILKSASEWVTNTASPLTGGLRVWDSLNRLGEAPLDDAQELANTSVARAVPIEWRRYKHDSSKPQSCNIRLLQDTGVKINLDPSGSKNRGVLARIPLRRFETSSAEIAPGNYSVSSPTLRPDYGFAPFRSALGEMENASVQPALKAQLFRAMLADATADWTVTGEGAINPNAMAQLLTSDGHSGQMLWEWRPPFLTGKTAKSNLLEQRPFVSVARIPSSFKSQLITSLTTAQGRSASSDDVDHLLVKLGTSGVGLSSLLAMGGTHVTGALGFYAMIWLMETIKTPDLDIFVVPIDACDNFLHALAGETSAENLTKRADLLAITMSDSEISLTPIEIKLYGLGSANPNPTLPGINDSRLSEGTSQLETTTKLLSLVLERFGELNAENDVNQFDRALWNNALGSLVEAAMKLSPKGTIDEERTHQRFERLISGEMALGLGAPILSFLSHRDVPNASRDVQSTFLDTEKSLLAGRPMGVFVTDIQLLLSELRKESSEDRSTVLWSELFLESLKNNEVVSVTQVKEIKNGPESITSIDEISDLVTPTDSEKTESPYETSSNPEPEIDLESSGADLDSEGDALVVDSSPVTAQAQAQAQAQQNIELKSFGVRFDVGHTIQSLKPVAVDYWPGNTELNQMNIGVVGDLGTGKTQLLKSLISQIRSGSRATQSNPLSFLIFDYKDDYTDPDFLEAVGGIVINPTQIPLNVFETEGDFSKATIYRKAQSFVGILEKIYSGIGPVQKSLLIKAVMESYDEDSQICPTVEDVQNNYLIKTGKEDSVSSILNRFVLPEVFTPDKAKMQSFNELINDKVLVVNLSPLASDSGTQNALVVLMLDLYYDYMMKLTKWDFEKVGDVQVRKLNSFLLVDEATNIMQYSFEILNRLLLQGRQFGVGVILASQFLNHYKVGSTNYGEPLRTWFIHKVPHVSESQLAALGLPRSSAETAKKISELGNHESYYSSFGHDGVFIRDIPFFELNRPAPDA